MNIALITEGGTDQIILKPIIEALLPDDEIYFRSIQPEMDSTDRQVGFGGWQLVLRALTLLNADEMLATNDLVVVQIDTDVSFETGFDVPHAEPGAKVDAKSLHDRVVQRLKALMPRTMTPAQTERILFAIGIHSIECWLVGLVDAGHNAKVIGNCIDRLNMALEKQKFCGKVKSIPNLKEPCAIDERAKNKGRSREIYFALGHSLSKTKAIQAQARLNVGFGAFVNELVGISKSGR